MAPYDSYLPVHLQVPNIQIIQKYYISSVKQIHKIAA